MRSRRINQQHKHRGNMTKINNNAVKMQKLRHAVERIRNLRSTEHRSDKKKSWLSQLMSRLNLETPPKDPGKN